jgi:hypothetical protein
MRARLAGRLWTPQELCPLLPEPVALASRIERDTLLKSLDEPGAAYFNCGGTWWVFSRLKSALKGEKTMARKDVKSKRAGSSAGKQVTSSRTSKGAKTAAGSGSAMTQRPGRKAK